MAAHRMQVADRIGACLPTELRARVPQAPIDLAGDVVPDRAGPVAVAAARAALDAGETHYTDRPGVGRLRAALAADIGERHGVELRADNVVVSSGALEGAFAAAWVALHGQPDAAMLLPDPAHPALPRLARLAGGSVQRVATSPHARFRVTADAVERACRAGGRLLLMGSPDAASGAAVEPGELAAIGDLAERHDLVVVLDESIARLAGPGATVATLRDAPRLADRTVVLGSFSHDAGLSSWRVGYFAATVEAFARMRSLKQALSICSPSVSQYAALGALPTLAERAARRAAALQGRADAFTAPLAAAGWPVVRPDVPAFVWVDVASVGLDGGIALERLRGVGVGGRRGEAFGQAAAGWLRFTMADEAAAMAEAAVRVGDALGRRAA